MTIVAAITIAADTGKQVLSKPKRETRMESAGRGTSMAHVIRVMTASFAGTIPPSLVPKKDEDNLAPAVRTDVDLLAPRRGKVEDAPEDLEAGETRDQANDEILQLAPRKEKAKEDLEVHQVGATVLHHHPNEGGPEEALGGFPVVDPDLRRQGGAATTPTPHQGHLLAVQEPHFLQEHLLLEKKDDPVAEITESGNATEEICVISGTHKLAKIGQTRAEHAGMVPSVRISTEPHRMAHQPSKRRNVSDNGNREGSLENSAPDHSLRLCRLTLPRPMELQPLPKRKKPATNGISAKGFHGPKARASTVDAPRSFLVPWQPSLA